MVGCVYNLKQMKNKLLLTLGLLGAMTLAAAERYVPEYLNAISITVRAELGYQRSEGSGTLFVRDINGTSATFAFSAGHVVEHLRRVEETIVSGKPSKIVTFENPKLVRELRNKDGRRTGEVVVDARIIRYSPADKHDLCLMIVLSEDFEAKASAEFYPKDGKLPRMGSHLNHCGSFLGGDGANSYSDGVISAHGRILFKMPFMQTTAPAYPGSSGGVVANDKGRSWKWAEKNGVEWAMNPTLKAPTMSEIEKLPIEGPAESDSKGDGTHKSYPFLIKRIDLRDAKGGAK